MTLELVHPPIVKSTRPSAPIVRKQYSPASLDGRKSAAVEKFAIPDRFLPPASYQGENLTCVAHAASRALEAHAIARGKQLQLDADEWHCCLMGLPSYYAMPSPMSVLAKTQWKHVPLLKNPPYSPARGCLAQIGKTHPFAGMTVLNTVADIKNRLASGRALIAEILVSKAFYYHTGNTPYVERGTLRGDHCVLLTGYTSKLWRIQHSGGPNWGVRGQGWIDPVSCRFLDGVRSVYDVLPFR